MRLADVVVGRLAYGLYGLVRRLPIDWISAVGGRLGRLVGACLGEPNRRALRNLALCFPDKTAAEHRAILRGMWEHLGRMAVEYAHLDRLIAADRIDVVGAHHFYEARGNGRPVILFSGHVGNWELTPFVAVLGGLNPTVIYRPLRNPIADRLIRSIREPSGAALVPRREAAGTILRVMSEGGCLAMLVDQAWRTGGIPVPLFGRNALTSPLIADLALRYDCLLVPGRVQRTRGSRFRITCCPPLSVERTGDAEADRRALLVRINELLEGWVRDAPEQWLWPHRRWSV